MSHYNLIYFTICTVCLAESVSAVINFGPTYPPTKGEVWPKPRNQRKQDNFYVLPSNFEFEVKNNNCTILFNAINRYKKTLKIQREIVHKRRLHNSSKNKHHTTKIKAEDPNFAGRLTELSLELKKPCEELPYLEMDESYTLEVSNNSRLISNSIWGMLRGLETFSQLAYLSDDYSEIRLNATYIDDGPLYPHRGLLLDTSRHYLSMPKLLAILDAMEMNKMNVLHWHIVDDQSFPYVSDVFPSLSEKGAFHPTMVYTKNDIAKLVDYARDRGIRIIPEFDMPGHTMSWGAAFPNVVTKCYRGPEVSSFGPLNPIHNTTYKIIKNLLPEIQGRFPDKYFHLGGDEVVTDCWASNPEILEYMQKHNLDSVNKLLNMFSEKVASYLSKATVPIVWEEMFENNVSLPKKTVVQVWKGAPGDLMDRVLAAGYRVLLSSPWYLDMLNGWELYYETDPRSIIKNPSLQYNVLGGEACMWGEMVDDRNVISRVWPRASAVAERLWSPVPPSKSFWSSVIVADNFTKRRMEEHACRMIRRGIDAEPPTGPGFCLTSN